MHFFPKSSTVLQGRILIWCYMDPGGCVKLQTQLHLPQLQGFSEQVGGLRSINRVYQSMLHFMERGGTKHTATVYSGNLLEPQGPALLTSQMPVCWKYQFNWQFSQPQYLKSTGVTDENNFADFSSPHVGLFSPLLRCSPYFLSQTLAAYETLIWSLAIMTKPTNGNLKRAHSSGSLDSSG